MAISATAKASIGGSLGTVAVGGPAATYLAWDHITLYEVEREVISKDVAFKFEQTSSNTKLVKISVDSEKSKSNWTSNYFWSCEITVEDEASKIEAHKNLGKFIQSNLQIPDKELNEKQKENKRLLVKACAKKRNKGKNNEVVGTLDIYKNKSPEEGFVFENHPNINFFLENYLYGAEEKAFEETVALDISENGSPVSITIKTKDEDGVWKKTEHHYWECKITSQTGTVNFSAEQLKKLLPEEKTQDTGSKNSQKKHLIKLCSKHRKDDAKDKQVTSELTIPTGKTDEVKWKEYLFGIKGQAQ